MECQDGGSGSSSGSRVAETRGRHAAKATGGGARRRWWEVDPTGCRRGGGRWRSSTATNKRMAVVADPVATGIESSRFGGGRHRELRIRWWRSSVASDPIAAAGQRRGEHRLGSFLL
uniref:DUF834 domain-containing protein n=1 Tax=Oryza punctata TaxID=4537 RepID=A0A0E0M825_ORYPU